MIDKTLKPLKRAKHKIRCFIFRFWLSDKERLAKAINHYQQDFNTEFKLRGVRK
jgi:hypothetical protein